MSQDDNEDASAGEAVDEAGTDGADVPSTEPPPMPTTEDAEPSEESSESDDEPAPESEEPRDHYVVATTEDGRETPIWCSEHNREDFTKEEAAETAIRYAAKMKRHGVGADKIKYKARGIEEFVLSKNPPREVEEEDGLVHAEITFAEDAHEAGRAAGAVPLPPSEVVDFLRGRRSVREDVPPEDSEPVSEDPS